jgi:hypothetical protein
LWTGFMKVNEVAKGVKSSAFLGLSLARYRVWLESVPAKD